MGIATNSMTCYSIKGDMEKKEFIICAAVHCKSETKYTHQPKNIETGFVVCGRRHHNSLITAKMINGLVLENHIQGFMTSLDRFVDRKEAGKIAFEAGQITKQTDCLISEDLY